MEEGRRMERTEHEMPAGTEARMKEYWMEEDCLVREGVRLVPPGGSEDSAMRGDLSMVPNPAAGEREGE